MRSTTPPAVELPVGYHQFHEDPLFNYQLNRPYSLGSGRYEDLAAAGAGVGSFGEWKDQMTVQAVRAQAEGRHLNAAAYFRAAEFYTFAGDPDKDSLYDRFAACFYRSPEAGAFTRVAVPYGDASLPALVLEPEAEPRGTVVLHGGYDSFIEELHALLRFFAGAGWRAVGFEGPGQGAPRRKAGLVMDYRWERPVAAVLDRLGLDDVTLVGLSMGGWFALRAAAFEPRVRRVIASGHAYDYMRVTPAAGAWLLTFFHDHLRGFTNRMSRWQIRRGGMEAWNISHLMYVVGADKPMDGLDFALELSEANLHCDAVTQDVLLLASTGDHFIPFRLHGEQKARLTAARSVTERVFTPADHAENHCQVGNIGLALQVMAAWIDQATRERSPE